MHYYTPARFAMQMDASFRRLVSYLILHLHLHLQRIRIGEMAMAAKLQKRSWGIEYQCRRLVTAIACLCTHPYVLHYFARHSAIPQPESCERSTDEYQSKPAHFLCSMSMPCTHLCASFRAARTSLSSFRNESTSLSCCFICKSTAWAASGRA